MYQIHIYELKKDQSKNMKLIVLYLFLVFQIINSVCIIFSIKKLTTNEIYIICESKYSLPIHIFIKGFNSTIRAIEPKDYILRNVRKYNCLSSNNFKFGVRNIY